MPGREFLEKVIRKDATESAKEGSESPAAPKAKKTSKVAKYRYNGSSWPGNIPARDLTPAEVEKLGFSGEQILELGCFDAVTEEED